MVYLGLDASPDELGIESYGYFIAPTMDSKKGRGYESTILSGRTAGLMALARIKKEK